MAIRGQGTDFAIQEQNILSEREFFMNHLYLALISPVLWWAGAPIALVPIPMAFALVLHLLDRSVLTAKARLDESLKATFSAEMPDEVPETPAIEEAVTSAGLPGLAAGTRDTEKDAFRKKLENAGFFKRSGAEKGVTEQEATLGVLASTVVPVLALGAPLSVSAVKDFLPKEGPLPSSGSEGKDLDVLAANFVVPVATSDSGLNETSATASSTESPQGTPANQAAGDNLLSMDIGDSWGSSPC